MIAFALLVATIAISERLADKFIGCNKSENQKAIFILTAIACYFLLLSWWYVWSENNTPLLAVPYEGTARFLGIAIMMLILIPLALVFNGFAIVLCGSALMAAARLAKKLFRRPSHRDEVDRP